MDFTIKTIATGLRTGGVCVLATLFARPALASPEIWLEAETHTYSDSISVEGLLNSLKADRFETGGEFSFTHDHARLGAEVFSNASGRWDMGFITRYDGLAQYSPDTALLLYSGANNRVVFEGDFDLSAQIRETWASGLFIAYKSPSLAGVTLSTRVTGLRGHKLTSGSALGAATLKAPDIIEGILELDYRYSDDFILGFEAEEPYGWGASVDVGLEWLATDKIALNLQVDDLWSSIRWQDAPRTIADVNTVTARLGEDGLLRVRPTVQGQRSTANYNQRYSARRQINLDYNVFGRWTVQQSVFNIEDLYLPTTSVEWAKSEHLSLSTHYEWKSGAVGLGVRWKSFAVNFMTDHIDPADALYLKVNLSGRWTF